MPIRINLLAEAQSEEELRRKDPVKRATIVAAFVVASVVFWASTLQFRIMAAKRGLHNLEARWQSVEKPYQEAVEHQRRVRDAEEKLAALQNYTTNRFLWGTTLNAFQQTLNGIDNVHVVRLRGEQAYVVADETPPRTNGTVIVPGKPATSTEKIVLSVEGVDASPQPGSQVNRFKQTIASVPYFQERLQKTNGVLLTSLSAPSSGPAAKTPYVTFTLQCYYPEKVR